MNIRPIRNEGDLKRALSRIDEIIDAKTGTREFDELEVLTTLVESYENLHHEIDPPDPVEAIKFRMEQQGLRRSSLASILGGKNRVSEILSRKRPLSLGMIRRLHKSLRISYDSLI